MRVLTFNPAADTIFGDAPKVRVRSRDGVLFIRPTDRQSAVNLPKGEFLVDLARKGGGARISVNADIQAGTLGLQTDKYGWFAIAGNPSRGAPAVKVAA